MKSLNKHNVTHVLGKTAKYSDAIGNALVFGGTVTGQPEIVAVGATAKLVSKGAKTANGLLKLK
jgi:hypothetical protein